MNECFIELDTEKLDYRHDMPDEYCEPTANIIRTGEAYLLLLSPGVGNAYYYMCSCERVHVTNTKVIIVGCFCEHFVRRLLRVHVMYVCMEGAKVDK